MVRVSTLLSAAAFLQSALAAYQVVEDFTGGSFFDHFDFFTGNDPTHGYVNYVDGGTAWNTGLVNTNGGVAYMGVDHTNVASGRGRNSVRITSKRAFTHGLVVLNLAHMPSSTCGVWPAFWTVGPNWPNSGEIDIIEGVNGQTNNFMTLHTSSNCANTGRNNGLLDPYSQNCDAAVNGNQGCSFHEPNGRSYGTGMNNAGGGIWAMEWTSAGISIWWWGGGNPAPSDVLSANPNPAGWGKPSANWAGNGCVWDQHFANQQIVFDTTFCGDWAGSVFGSDGNCNWRGNCVDYVRNSPNDFRDAYWSVRALRLYQQNGRNGRRSTDGLTPADIRRLAESGEGFVPVDGLSLAYNQTLIDLQVRECQDSGLCMRDPEPEPAAASQIAPELVPEADRTVDAADAASAARAHRVTKRAAASQIAPSLVPAASRTVNPSVAASNARMGRATAAVKAKKF